MALLPDWWTVLFMFLRDQMLDFINPMCQTFELKIIAGIQQGKHSFALQPLPNGWASSSGKVIATNAKRMSGLDQVMSSLSDDVGAKPK